MPLMPVPGLRLSAHTEVFYKDPSDPDAEQVLVHTSRPCPVCGRALDGSQPVVPAGDDRQIHARCVS